jgi:hypothetical protein
MVIFFPFDAAAVVFDAADDAAALAVVAAALAVVAAAVVFAAAAVVAFVPDALPHPARILPQTQPASKTVNSFFRSFFMIWMPPPEFSFLMHLYYIGFLLYLKLTCVFFAYLIFLSFY